MDSKIPSWRQALAQAFTSIDALCQYLQIDVNALPVQPASKNFPLLAPRGFAACMQTGDPDDPLLRQVLPLQAEWNDYPGYSLDAVGDLAAVASAGLIHKYHGRALFIVTGACAIHCRYCFRRNFPYGEQQLNGEKLQKAIAYLQAHGEINEIILSGGDPLLFSDEKLAGLLGELADIGHIRRIRIHSRVPVVLPCRITNDFLDMLGATAKQIVLVIHANHGNELSAEVGLACAAIKQRGVTLLNQSVLLKGVNDDSNVLCRLSEKLFGFGVLPYYLHMPDHAQGTKHFAVSEQQASDIMRRVRERLPGYLVPKLVREQAGAAYKLSV
ncbi:MAG: EF-P beta-lysylation protein EpmB [Methylomonas sp.]